MLPTKAFTPCLHRLASAPRVSPEKAEAELSPCQSHPAPGLPLELGKTRRSHYLPTESPVPSTRLGMAVFQGQVAFTCRSPPPPYGGKILSSVQRLEASPWEMKIVTSTTHHRRGTSHEGGSLLEGSSAPGAGLAGICQPALWTLLGDGRSHA